MFYVSYARDGHRSHLFSFGQGPVFEYSTGTISSMTAMTDSDITKIADEKLLSHSARVKDKVLLITGGASGIGKATALQFAAHGAKVVIGDKDAAGAQATVDEIVRAGGLATCISCDVSAWDDVVALFELAMKAYGAIDIVVACAGVSEIGAFGVVKFDTNGKPLKPILATIDINLIGTLYIAHLAQHYLAQARTEGDLKSLVLLGSIASWKAIRRGTMYSASKHAVLGTMRSLHPDFAEQDIRISVVSPFFADTPIVALPIKLLLAGIPLTPVTRIVGAIFYSATDPDPDSNGSAWLLLDDGPVFQVSKEDFKLGVYKVLDDRINSLQKGVTGLVYYSRLVKDVIRLLKAPLTLTLLGGLIWHQQNSIRQLVHL
ncbi:NAD(P)-binding protein [Guyanagaster necrorhizus]|uniref:NAD(P)-binding protein n=1 Tax=Guyanagaster necrorhizus TaxID=856835 RepID=A0A9P7VVI3_9AGAR|nr:NAD(P)-binding protein [Guyanagaster necrorhizus MCA 3950]KAG7446651.1 NAD(P)-binding protein [Guyanagaster necrorhizus MCA 3950]